jgi:hypothetical protein
MKFTKLNYVKRGEVTKAIRQSCPTASFPKDQNKATVTVWLQDEDLPALDAVANSFGLPKPFHPHCSETYSRVRDVWLFKDDANLAAYEEEWAQVRAKENARLRKERDEERAWYKSQGREIPSYLMWAISPAEAYCLGA